MGPSLGIGIQGCVQADLSPPAHLGTLLVGHPFFGAGAGADGDEIWRPWRRWFP